MSLGAWSGGFLAAAGSGLVLLALHPFTTYPLSLGVLAKRRGRPVRLGVPETGKIALCVCAYNEERVIGAKVDNMLAMRAAVPELEILVYVDGASDRTVEILQGYQNQVRLVASQARHGKTHGMNMLVSQTSADLLVFSDANVMFAADAVPRLLVPFADPAVGAVCGHLLYTGLDGNATVKTGSLYWRLEERIKALESATGSVMGADGSIFAIRRALHSPPPVDLIDDMYVSLAILCEGSRIVRADDAYAYEESVSRPAEEFRRKIRIACQAFNVHRALWPRLRVIPLLDRYKYVSHKLLRWTAIYLLALGGAAILGGIALAGSTWVALSLLTAAFVLSGASLAARSGPLATVRDILGAFVATGIGVARSLRGDRFQTWNPPASARGVTQVVPRDFVATVDEHV